MVSSSQCPLNSSPHSSTIPIVTPRQYQPWSCYSLAPSIPFLFGTKAVILYSHSHTTIQKYHSEHFCSNPLLLGLSPELCPSWLNLLISDFTPILTSLSLHIQVHTLIGTHVSTNMSIHRYTCTLRGIHRHTRAHGDTDMLTLKGVCTYAHIHTYINP